MQSVMKHVALGVAATVAGGTAIAAQADQQKAPQVAKAATKPVKLTDSQMAKVTAAGAGGAHFVSNPGTVSMCKGTKNFLVAINCC